MKRFSITGATGEQLAKRIFKLAWDACGGPVGFGVFQDRGSAMTEDQIWKNVMTDGDYQTSNPRSKPREAYGEAYGDYVFGRMMKLCVNFGADYVELNDNWRGDYQAFSGKYTDAPALVEAAAKSIGAKIVAAEPATA